MRSTATSAQVPSRHAPDLIGRSSWGGGPSRRYIVGVVTADIVSPAACFARVIGDRVRLPAECPRCACCHDLLLGWCVRWWAVLAPGLLGSPDRAQGCWRLVR